MRTLTIWQMLDALYGIIGDLGKYDVDHVRNFYETCQHNRDISVLSDKQVEIIATTFEKHFS